jgi:hypothetical protein
MWDKTSDILDSVLFQKSLDVGIGTTAPAAAPERPIAPGVGDRYVPKPAAPAKGCPTNVWHGPLSRERGCHQLAAVYRTDYLGRR